MNWPNGECWKWVLHMCIIICSLLTHPISRRKMSRAFKMSLSNILIPFFRYLVPHLSPLKAVNIHILSFGIISSCERCHLLSESIFTRVLYHHVKFVGKYFLRKFKFSFSNHECLMIACVLCMWHMFRIHLINRTETKWIIVNKI